MSSCIDRSKLESALSLSQFVIFNTYLQSLASLSPAPLPCHEIGLIRITSTAQYEPPPFSLFPLLTALQSLDITFAYVIQVTPCGLTSYIGVAHPCLSLVGIQLIKDYLCSHAPSATYHVLSEEEITHLLCTEVITSTTFYAPTSMPTAPLKTLFTPLPPTNYTLLFLATPMSLCKHLQFQTSFQTLYNALYPFKDLRFDQTCTNHHSTTDTCSHAHNCQETAGSSESNGSTTNESCTQSANTNTSVSLKPKDTLSNTTATGGSSSSTAGQTTSRTLTTNASQQSSCNQSISDSNTCTHTTAILTRYTQFDLQVDTLLTKCSALSEFVEANLYPPTFYFSTYFLSPSLSTNVGTAATYMHLFTTSIPTYYPQAITTWTQDSPSYCEVRHTLTSLSHPSFCCPSYEQCVTPALPWSGRSIEQVFA